MGGGVDHQVADRALQRQGIGRKRHRRQRPLSHRIAEGAQFLRHLILVQGDGVVGDGVASGQSASHLPRSSSSSTNSAGRRIRVRGLRWSWPGAATRRIRLSITDFSRADRWFSARAVVWAFNSPVSGICASAAAPDPIHGAFQDPQGPGDACGHNQRHHRGAHTISAIQAPKMRPLARRAQAGQRQGQPPYRPRFAASSLADRRQPPAESPFPAALGFGQSAESNAPIVTTPLARSDFKVAVLAQGTIKPRNLAAVAPRPWAGSPPARSNWARP